MKKSNTLFTLAFFAILAFSSCEREQWGNAQKGPDDIDNRAEGQIGLSALKVSVDEKTATTVTRAGINTDNFIIRIYDMDKEGKMVQEWEYSEMPEIFTLKVSHYSITAMSHEVQPAEFEKPYYFSKQDFEITENTTIINTTGINIFAIIFPIKLLTNSKIGSNTVLVVILPV